jgi:RNA polymerase sigma factor (sigma-70 family)
MPLMTGPQAETRSDEFSAFYSAHFGRIATQLHAYLGDRFEAQDLTQEAFCRAYDRWGRISTYERPEFWVRQVAWNLATNRLRHLKVAVRHLARQREEQVDGPTPDRVALVRELAKLPPKHRLAVVLHHIGGLSTSEIARQQNVAEGTVRSWLTRGRTALAERLVEAPTPWGSAPAIDQTLSKVRRKRALRRATLAAVLALLLALPVAIILRGKGSEPPFIGPTSPPSPSPSPVPSPTPAAVALSSCAGRTLPRLPGAPHAGFSGGDPSGRYLVGETVSPKTDENGPVLWTDGVASTFTPPGKRITGLVVNSRGVVAGSSNGDGNHWIVWTYQEGRVDVLMEGESPDDALEVAGINTRGDILLVNWNDGPPKVRFAGPNPVVRELPAPDSGTVRLYARGIGDDGTVVASAADRAVIWTPEGKPRELAVPSGWKATAVGIRGEWVVGLALHQPIDPYYHMESRTVLRWNLRTGEVTQVAGLDGVAGVTAHGWVLGSTRGGRSFVDMNGKRLELPTPAGASDAYVSFISDDGRVIGGETKVQPGGANVAIRWTCS